MDKFKTDTKFEDLFLSIIADNFALKADLTLCQSLIFEMVQKKGITLEEFESMFLKHKKVAGTKFVSDYEYFTDEFKVELKKQFS